MTATIQWNNPVLVGHTHTPILKQTTHGAVLRGENTHDDCAAMVGYRRWTSTMTNGVDRSACYLVWAERRCAVAVMTVLVLMTVEAVVLILH